MTVPSGTRQWILRDLERQELKEQEALEKSMATAVVLAEGARRLDPSAMALVRGRRAEVV